MAGASASHATIMLAGIASVAAGALSMAAGEYVSVSTQRELETSELERQKADLERDPERELAVLTRLFEQRGVEPLVAKEVAQQMSAKDALAVHARAELGIDPESVANPWAAAFASMNLLRRRRSDSRGRDDPVTASDRDLGKRRRGRPGHDRDRARIGRLGRIPMIPSVVRNVAGLLAMAVTYGVGNLAGTQL